MNPDPINAAQVVVPLAAFWLLLIWAGTRHVRRREMAANRQRLADHMADVRGIGPLDERWLDLREREGRA